MTNDDLIALVKEGLKRRKIKIAVHPQNALEFCDMDDYFEKYGHTLVRNLETQLSPLSQLKEKVDELVFISKRPYPQEYQLSMEHWNALHMGTMCFLWNQWGLEKRFREWGLLMAGLLNNIGSSTLECQ